jgi:hypothetical protein
VRAGTGLGYTLPDAWGSTENTTFEIVHNLRALVVESTVVSKFAESNFDENVIWTD